MIFKQQLTDISTVLNNTGNTTKLLTSFNALDVAQQKVLLSSSLLSEKQKEQCITMATLSAANTKYTAEQLTKATGISTETLATWGLIESTDVLTISELAEKAASDTQAKSVLDKIIAQNAADVANGKVIASNTALVTSEGGATLATGTFTTAIKANISAMWTWMTTTPLGWLTLLATGIFAVVKAYDALTVSVKEQKEKMEDSLSAYKDAKSELSNITTELDNQEQAMDDLLAKEKLTYAEQGQLEELQAITKELRIQKDLAEREEGRTQKELAQDASGLFKKQFGKYDISSDAISEYRNNANITGNNAILISDQNDISAMIAGYKQFNDLLDEAYGSDNQENIDHFKSLTEDLRDSIFDTAKDLQEQQSNIADYYNTIKDLPYDELTSDQKEIVDSYNYISDAIELIYEQLDPNTWKSMQIESVFDTEGIEKTKEELVEMVKAGELDESILQSYPKLSEALEQNKVSASELRNELEALADAEKNVQDSTSHFETEISKTFDQAWSDSFTSEDDAVKELGNSLLDLAEKGRLTIETFNEADSTDYFKNLGISADEAVAKINRLVDESKQLSSMSSQISSMANALGTKQEDGFVSADTLSGFDVEVRGLESWDRFQEVLGSTTSLYEDCEEAANALATEWVNSSDFLAQLTEQNREYYETQLEAMGIENYEEVISYAMALNEAKEVLAQSSLELGNATYDEIENLIEEGTYLGLTADLILALYDSKVAEQAVTLKTAEDCENLIALAGDTDRTSKSIELLIQLMEIYTGLENNVYGKNNEARAKALAKVDSIKKELEAIANGETAKMEIEPTVKLGNRGKSSAKSAGKEAGKSYKDGLKEELSDLEGIISSLSKAIDSQKEVISSQKEVALEAIESQISALEAERDARLEAIEAEKKALQDSIKAIDKQIDAKKKEIDAINDAAKARQHEIDLQKAQYDLERMQNQRTILQYSEDKGMHYINDSSGVRDAKEKVDDAKRQLAIDAIEKEIDLLEEQKDLLNEQIDLLDEQAESIKNFYDVQIKSLEKQKESTEKYFESLIKSIEGSKDKYQELLDIVDKAELSGKLKKLGIDEEALLNGSEEEFEKLKNAYLNVVFQVNEGNEEILSSLRELSGYEGTAPTVLSDTTEKLGEMDKQLDDSVQNMDKLSDSATTASKGTSDIATSMDELNTNTEGLSDNLTDINDALTDIPGTNNLDNITTSFTNLGKAIQTVADALGIGEEGAVSTLITALQEIGTLSLDGTDGEGVITQFQNLKTAVEDVTSAISGGGSSGGQEGDASTSSSPSMSSGTGGEDANGLLGAIEEIKSVTDKALGGGGEGEESEGEGSGAIPQFQELKTAVDDVTAAIGIEDSEGSEGSENTLIGALRTQYETASEVLPETKALFEELLESIMECVSALNSMVGLIGSMSEISGFSGGGSIIPNITPHAKGTVGNAFAKGTGKYKGLPHDEKNALVSEYGQTEMTVLPNGKTIITDKPTMMDLPKDTVIFNEDQTKQILDNKVDAKVVKSYANGTVEYSDGTIITPDGNVLRPLREGDRGWELMKAFEPLVAKIQKGEEIFSNAMFEHQKQMEKWTKEITNNTAISNITNNTKPSVTIGDINVTCPGVTEQQVAEHLGSVIGKELDKQFSGFHNYTDQMSRIR